MDVRVPSGRLKELYELAVEAVREHRLPDDFAEDCAQDVISDLLADGCGLRSWPPSIEIRDLLARRAARARQGTRRRRTRERDAALGRLRRAALTGLSTPPLCPGLACLARFHPEPRRFLDALLAAARSTAHEPEVLQRRQLRAFVLGYGDCRPVAKLHALLKAPTPRATVQRLRRISGRIERLLVRSLVLPPVDRQRLADWLESAKTVPEEEKVENAATSLLERLSVRVEEALRELLEP